MALIILVPSSLDVKAITIQTTKGLQAALATRAAASVDMNQQRFMEVEVSVMTGSTMATESERGGPSSHLDSVEGSQDDRTRGRKAVCDRLRVQALLTEESTIRCTIDDL